MFEKQTGCARYGSVGTLEANNGSRAAHQMVSSARILQLMTRLNKFRNSLLTRVARRRTHGHAVVRERMARGQWCAEDGGGLGGGVRDEGDGP